MGMRNCVSVVVIVGLCMHPAHVAVAQTRYSEAQRYYNASPGAATAASATAPATTAPSGGQTSFKPEELEQIVAPIALYPDSLLAQVLMASTYPLEVVQADRWGKANPKGKDSPETLNKLTWDPSVKSLLNFPQVLTMMSEKLDWTVKLGDAFIADQKALMDAVQRLRNKAYASGNLKSSKEQTVKVEPASTTGPAVAGASSSTQVIVVESSSPSVVYVPTYNPTVVYGSWPYPAYPPASYYPPGYVAGTALLSFGIGVACGAAWGNAWGGCNWHGGDVDIDVNRNVNFNGNIDREAARANMDARQGERDTRQGERQTGRDTRQGERQGGTGGTGKFQHDPAHRQGVGYRDQATNEKFRGSQASQAQVAARDSYRGRAETGRQDLNRGGASDFRGSGAGGTGGLGASGGGAGSGVRASSDMRGGTGRTPSASNYSGTRSSGLSGAGSSGSSARAASSRGQTSRSSSSYSGNRGGSSYSGGGGSRGGGGGASRGGGGGRGGGGRR